MISHMMAVAANEIRIGTRNRWLLLAAIILLLFALVLGFLGSAPTGDVKAGRLTLTVASLATLSVYLVPLLALLLAFDTIAGEVERGTLSLMLASSISRTSIILGKFLGHITVIAMAIIVGYGGAGSVVMALTGDGFDGFVHLTRLIVTSIALGAVFLAIGYVASASVRATGTAAALAIGIWLVAVVLYDLGLLGALVADKDGIFAKAIFPYLLVANPADAFRLYNVTALKDASVATGFSGAAANLPFPPVATLLALAIWLVLMLTAATSIFRRLEP